MKNWLSILLPSNNPVNLERFLKSLSGENYYGGLDIEFLIDKDPASSVSELYNRLFERAKGEWIWIANDDLICRTKNWDWYFKEATKVYPDKIALIYPNDLMFEETFCCFPLVNREIVKDLFPMPYKKYKVDDSFMDIIPKNRFIYLDNVVMEHDHFNDGPGFPTKSGKIYPIDYELGKIDSWFWLTEGGKRREIRNRLCNQVKECLSVQ